MVLAALPLFLLIPFSSLYHPNILGNLLIPNRSLIARAIEQGRTMDHPGDSVVVLFGGEAPFIIRQLVNDTTS